MKTKRRTFLKAVISVGVSPILITKSGRSAVKARKPKGDRIFKMRRKTSTNLCGIESLVFEQCLYSIDKNGNETFLKVLASKEYKIKKAKIVRETA